MPVYIMHMNHLPVFQQLHAAKVKTQGQRGESANLYHVCHREIKALVYSGALLSLLT